MAQPPPSPPPPGQTGPRFRLGELLLREGLISTEQLQRGLEEQRALGGRLGRHLVELGFIHEQALLDVLSRQLRIPQINLDEPGVISPDARRYARADLTEQWGFCPIAFDARRNVLVIAVSEPDPGLLSNIEGQLGLKVEPRIAPSEAIDRACRRLFYGEDAPPQRVAGLQVQRTEVSGRRPSNLAADLGQPESLPAPTAGFQPPSPWGPPAADPAALQALQQQVERLEKSLAAQSRVLRAVAELLIEKGVFSTAELVRKQAPSKSS